MPSINHSGQSSDVEDKVARSIEISDEPVEFACATTQQSIPSPQDESAGPSTTLCPPSTPRKGWVKSSVLLEPFSPRSSKPWGHRMLEDMTLREKRLASMPPKCLQCSINKSTLELNKKQMHDQEALHKAKLAKAEGIHQEEKTTWVMERRDLVAVIKEEKARRSVCDEDHIPGGQHRAIVAGLLKDSEDDAETISQLQVEIRKLKAEMAALKEGLQLQASIDTEGPDQNYSSINLDRELTIEPNNIIALL